jgi:hypothetical protein
MPSFSPHALRPSTFRAPDGVHQRRLALAVVGGARPRGDWCSSATARLQGFSSCSPAAFPHQWSVWWGEASRAAASAPPSASKIFVIRAEVGKRAGPRRRRPPAMRGEGELLLPGRGAAFRPRPGRRSCRARAGHAQILLAPLAAPGGRSTRHTPRGRYSCSGLALVRSGVRTCRCALGRPLFAGAVLEGRWPLSSVLRWWSP